MAYKYKAVKTVCLADGTIFKANTVREITAEMAKPLIERGVIEKLTSFKPKATKSKTTTAATAAAAPAIKTAVTTELTADA